IIPYLVAIQVAVGMFRASGALDAIIGAINPLTSAVGFPPEALPMALLRPLSGSGALGVMTEAMQTYGPDSFVGYLVSTLQGSTETTFYVLAVYGGAIGLKRTRHALPACLIADIAGVVGATAACHLLVSAL
ncbi:MAG: spore maturation protein, partial [Acidobacteriota bacterium]|nr:spore maturation protein [Acidobacteriota bacterium]